MMRLEGTLKTAVALATLWASGGGALSAQTTINLGQSTSSASLSTELLDTVPVGRLNPLQLLQRLPAPAGMDQRVLTYVRRDPFNTRRPGAGAARGRADIQVNCITQTATNRLVGRGRPRFDRDSGEAVLVDRVDGDLGCLDFFTDVGFRGGQRQPAGSTVRAETTVQNLPEDSDPACFTPTTLCLNGGRFTVDVDWRNFGGQTGQGVGVATAEDRGEFFFFDPQNWELLVKVFDGCSFNDHYWVFLSSAADVEVTLTVTDTETAVTRQFGSGLGQPMGAVVDTQAFATCP